MSDPARLPPRRTDNKAVAKVSTALLEAVSALADELGYPIPDIMNQGAEMVLAHYGKTVPPIRPELESSTR